MDYWVRQADTPLFPDIEWNKPERRDHAGRLLIASGSQHALNASAESYAITRREGIGSIIVALPDKTKRLVGPTLPEAVFLPSTQTGEFSQEGEHELLEYAMHSDGILLPGDLGRNSQTTILLELLLKNYNGRAVITRDTLDLLPAGHQLLLTRPATTLVLGFAQLQKLIKPTGTALTFTMDLVKLLDFLHELTKHYPLAIVTVHQNQLIVASGSKVSTTKLKTAGEPAHWRLQLASLAACYQIWNPTKSFEALTFASSIVASKN